jgi:hypothetical protein
MIHNLTLLGLMDKLFFFFSRTQDKKTTNI